MKLGIIAEPVEQSFSDAKKRKISSLEICLHPTTGLDMYYAKIEKIRGIKKYITQYGIDIASIGSWGSDKLDESGKVIESEIKMGYELIDLAAEVDCKNVVVGANYIDNMSYLDNVLAAIQYIEKLLAYAKDKNVKISTYNCRWNNFIVDDMAWTMIHGHLKELGIKYDPSHAIYAGGDYLSEMKKWGSRFHHVHIKGALVIDNERFDDPPAGMDQINWGAFMAILYAHKYDACVSLEPHSQNWKDDLGDKGIDFSANYMQQFLLM